MQIEIDCAECGETLTWTIPGHHLRTIRDVAIDHLDQFPEFNRGTITKLGTTGSVACGGDRSKNPERN